MASRVHLLWCALACAARSAAERSLADPASFVVVQGLWLLDTDAFLNNFRVPLDRFLESDPLKPLDADKVLFPWNNTHWGGRKAKSLGHARWATTGALALVSCAPARLLLKRWWAGANHRSDQRESAWKSPWPRLLDGVEVHWSIPTQTRVHPSTGTGRTCLRDRGRELAARRV